MELKLLPFFILQYIVSGSQCNGMYQTTASTNTDGDPFPTVDPNVALQGQCVIVCDAALPIMRKQSSLGQRSQRVAFSVTRTSDALGEGMFTYRTKQGEIRTIVTFDSILLNYGNCYDTARHHFTPSVNGVYSLEFRIIKTFNSNGLVVALTVNGGAMVHAFADANGADHETASNGALLHLVKGDHVRIEVVEGALGAGWKYSTFTGHLLYEDLQ
ncbi:cerebellin-1-like [Ciona intestinalis]